MRIQGQAESLGRTRSRIQTLNLTLGLSLLAILSSFTITVEATQLPSPIKKHERQDSRAPLKSKASPVPLLWEDVGLCYRGGADAVVASEDSGNMVLNLVGFLKDSIVRTATSTGDLYKNHQKCNQIRKKQKAYRDSVLQQWEETGMYANETPKEKQKRVQELQGGITFDEYIFLLKGKEDRGKVLNMGFLMWGAPKFLPYALMFNPDMLPSPFRAGVQEGQDAAAILTGEETSRQKISRERSAIIISTLLEMERQAKTIAGGPMASLNFFGKKKKSEKQIALQKLNKKTEQLLVASAISNDPNVVLKALAPFLYKVSKADDGSKKSKKDPHVGDFTRAEKRLVSVPSAIVKGIGNAITGAPPGLLANISPAFLGRGKVVAHIQKLEQSDEFLVQTNYDLESIPEYLLREVCQDRLMDASHTKSNDELRRSLETWLEVAVRQPKEVVANLQSKSENKDKTVYYNGVLGRFALLAYYGCATVRESNANRLPQLLYTGSGSSSTSGN